MSVLSTSFCHTRDLSFWIGVKTFVKAGDTRLTGLTPLSASYIRAANQINEANLDIPLKKHSGFF
jgi:hypothetical protein